MIRAARLLLLVFTTLGALVVGTMEAVRVLPDSWRIITEVGPLSLIANAGANFSAFRFRLENRTEFAVTATSNRLIMVSYQARVMCDRFTYRGSGRFLGIGYRITFGEVETKVSCPTAVDDQLQPLTQSVPRFRFYSFYAPTWLTFSVFAAYPAFVALRRFRRYRASRREGSCRECGYDLTGNESGICPECGKPIPVLASESQP